MDLYIRMECQSFASTQLNLKYPYQYARLVLRLFRTVCFYTHSSLVSRRPWSRTYTTTSSFYTNKFYHRIPRLPQNMHSSKKRKCTVSRQNSLTDRYADISRCSIGLPCALQAVVSSISALKRRTKPDKISHPSVGTQAEIAKREADKQKLSSLRLTVAHLETYILSMDSMQKWGYITEVPAGEGGSRPSEEGAVQKCERCNESFMVKRKEEADECLYHWGRKFVNKQNGKRCLTPLMQDGLSRR